VVACLATAALALAACSSANPPASPSPSAESGTEATPTATPTLRVAAALARTRRHTAARRQPAADDPLILHPSSDTEISVRSQTGCNTEYCQGDYRLGDDPLFDAATGKQVGTLVYVEFVVTTADPLWLSPANTITLEGRGQIAFSEALQTMAPGGLRRERSVGAPASSSAQGAMSSAGRSAAAATS
jgi:hypothetical protein